MTAPSEYPSSNTRVPEEMIPRLSISHSQYLSPSLHEHIRVRPAYSFVRRPSPQTECKLPQLRHRLPKPQLQRLEFLSHACPAEVGMYGVTERSRSASAALRRANGASTNSLAGVVSLAPLWLHGVKLPQVNDDVLQVHK